MKKSILTIAIVGATSVHAEPVTENAELTEFIPQTLVSNRIEITNLESLETQGWERVSGESWQRATEHGTETLSVGLTSMREAAEQIKQEINQIQASNTPEMKSLMREAALQVQLDQLEAIILNEKSKKPVNNNDQLNSWVVGSLCNGDNMLFRHELKQISLLEFNMEAETNGPIPFGPIDPTSSTYSYAKAQLSSGPGGTLNTITSAGWDMRALAIAWETSPTFGCGQYAAFSWAYYTGSQCSGSISYSTQVTACP